ncbi:MAG: hypothetical protein D6739_12510, partial [Nitrospirae bacterium]
GEMVRALRADHPALAAVLEHARVARCDRERLELHFRADPFLVAQVEQRRDLLEAEARRRLGPQVEVAVARGEAGAASVAERRQARLAERRRRVEENPRVKAALETFEGSVVEVELAPESEEESDHG